MTASSLHGSSVLGRARAPLPSYEPKTHSQPLPRVLGTSSAAWGPKYLFLLRGSGIIPPRQVEPKHLTSTASHLRHLQSSRCHRQRISPKQLQVRGFRYSSSTPSSRSERRPFVLRDMRRWPILMPPVMKIWPSWVSISRRFLDCGVIYRP